MTLKAMRVPSVVGGLALAAILLAAAPATAGVRTCDGRAATIQRGDADNDLVGTDGNDVIVAGGGDDNIESGEGRDRVCGEDGNDVLDGGGGGDFLNGASGRDLGHGGNGSDEVAGGPGNDGGTAPFRAGTFEPRLLGNLGNDMVTGGRGNDGDLPTAGFQGLDGGPGDDELFGGSGEDEIDERTGPTTGAPADVDQVFGGDGEENVAVDDGDPNDIVDCGPPDPFSVSHDTGDQVNCTAVLTQ